MEGLILPIITPFKNGEIDFASYRNLIEYYIPKGINGIIPLGTTGESPTIEEDEFEKMVEVTVEAVNGRIPVYIGKGGNSTKKVIKSIKILEKYKVDGILSVCPYYNKPGQQGLFEHFKALSESTFLNIVIYNIPYRTGVNLENETLLRLAGFKNIIGVKDSSGNIIQSLELIYNKPEGFSVLTGEDNFFYNNLVNGGDGGILASAHLNTEKFVDIYRLVMNNNHVEALKIWKDISQIIPFLFKEPNPAPVKYCLKKSGMINSDEVRLPLTTISRELKDKLDSYIQLL